MNGVSSNVINHSIHTTRDALSNGEQAGSMESLIDQWVDPITSGLHSRQPACHANGGNNLTLYTYHG